MHLANTMDLTNLTYIKYVLIFVIGVIAGRFSMAIQYAFMEKKADKQKESTLKKNKKTNAA